jgi:hypothetical protein
MAEMTDQSRESGAILDAEAAPQGRPAPAALEDEGVGYARADLKDALARIRDTAGPMKLGEAERSRSAEDPEDEGTLVDQVRALGAKVDRLIDVVESARASTGSAVTASATVDEHLAGLSARIEEAQATQARADGRLLGLSIAVVVLTVVVLALLVVDMAPGLGS